jgi:MoaA/NifB/PqqE/SkfB family radical SAM enzyme
MHRTFSTSTLANASPSTFTGTNALDFLWLELTNRCNLQCVHCYTESHPHSGERDLLTRDDYQDIMRQARALGCRKIQFIGGEPQLNRDFEALLHTAKDYGFAFVEVFTNLMQLNETTLRYAADNGIHFATSVYSDDACEHDAITQKAGSHPRTINNLKRLVAAGVPTRVGVIAIKQSPATIGRTTEFLNKLGVLHVSSSPIKEFGRGEAVLGEKPKLSGLCGHCWAGKLCVAPDGVAYPCVMAREWPVGNTREQPLSEIVAGQALGGMRQTIYDTVWRRPRLYTGCIPEDMPIMVCEPDWCDPTGACSPNEGWSGGERCTPDSAGCEPRLNPCFPERCLPNRCEPDGGCPQDCVPQPGCNQTPCDPGICPQS